MEFTKKLQQFLPNFLRSSGTNESSHPEMSMGRVGRKMTTKAFQHLVSERKCEVKREADERRRQGLKRIADMNSRTGINPLELFPGEIWEKILDKLSPEDRWNMSQVHDKFRDLMKSCLIQDILFPLVIDFKTPLLQKYLVPDFNSPGNEDLEQLMILRSVSKSFRDAVDGWIEDRLLHLMRTCEPADRVGLGGRYVLNALEFRLVKVWKVINKLFKFIKPEGVGPKRFFIRALRNYFVPSAPLCTVRGLDMEYSPSFPGRVSCFVDDVTEFLENVGEQIWHIDIDLFGIDLDEAKVNPQEIIREWLMLMPNLKWLDLRDASFGRPARSLKEEVMPRLDALERFDFASHSNWNTPICDAILAANAHLKIFTKELGRGSPFLHYLDNPLELSLPLQTLFLGAKRQSYWNTPLLKQISRKKNNWNLKQLKLWMCEVHDYDELVKLYSIGRVFGFLEKLKTLEDIELHMDHVTIDKDVNLLQLPNLKEFWIEFGPVVKCSGDIAFFFSLHFLLNCWKLKKLTWKNLIEDWLPLQRALLEGGKGIMIDFKGRGEDLSGTNVWGAFPLLSSIKVQFREGDEDKTQIYFR